MIFNAIYYLDKPTTIALISDRFLYSKSIFERMFGEKFDRLNLVVARNKAQYDEILQTEKPAWGVTAHKGGTVYLFDPFLWRKNPTGHNLSDLTPSLIHELVHHYFFVNHIKAPVWFEEGLAVLVSDQKKGGKRRDFFKLKKTHTVPDILDDTIDFKSLKAREPLMHYLTFFMFVSFLCKEFGFKKVIQFVKSVKDGQVFEESFHKFLGASVRDAWLKFVNQMATGAGNGGVLR